MINKKLIHFNTNDCFKAEFVNNNISETSIVFVKDSRTIHTHSQDYVFVNWTILAGDAPEGYEKFMTSDGHEFCSADETYYVKT